MKFTKEQAVKELTAKYKPRYGDPAKWERTITECVEHAMELIGEDSETELDVFAGQVMKFLDTTGGMVLKETSLVASEKQQQYEDLKKQYETAGANVTRHDDELLRRLEALEKASEESRRLDAIATKRGEIIEKVKANGVKDEKDIAMVDFMLSNANITPDTDTDAEAGRYVEAVNKFNAGRGGEDQTPPPAGGSHDDKINAAIEGAARIARERIA